MPSTARLQRCRRRQLVAQPQRVAQLLTESTDAVAALHALFAGNPVTVPRAWLLMVKARTLKRALQAVAGLRTKRARRGTIQRWIKRHPEFYAAVHSRSSGANVNVMQRLYRRAMVLKIGTEKISMTSNAAIWFACRRRNTTRPARRRFSSG